MAEPHQGHCPARKGHKPRTPSAIHILLCIAAVFFSSLFDPLMVVGAVACGELRC